MSNRELEMYNEMKLEDLEIVISGLNEERLDIAQAIDEGNMDEKYGEKQYKKIDKKYSELYLLFEKRLANQHRDFIGCVIK